MPFLPVNHRMEVHPARVVPQGDGLGHGRLVKLAFDDQSAE